MFSEMFWQLNTYRSNRHKYLNVRNRFRGAHTEYELQLDALDLCYHSFGPHIVTLCSNEPSHAQDPYFGHSMPTEQTDMRSYTIAQDHVLAIPYPQIQMTGLAIQPKPYCSETTIKLFGHLIGTKLWE
jgi:hypothetical protein